MGDIIQIVFGLLTFAIMIYAFKGFIPVVHPSSFVHPQAAVTGNVIIGKNVYIGPGAALRGDWGAIIIEDGVMCKRTVPSICFRGKLFCSKNLHILAMAPLFTAEQLVETQ